MTSQLLKLILLMSIIFQVGCNITFKKKSAADQKQISVVKDKSNKQRLSKNSTLNKDTHIINAFYADVTNEIIRKDMVLHTKISKKQKNKLIVGEVIPRDIQVMPLPLVLVKKLSALPLSLLRVQVGEHVILMNVKSRRILDVIEI